MITKFLGALTAIKMLIEAGFTLLALVREYLKKLEQERRIKKLEEALKEAEKPGTVDEKAIRACRLEEVFNPDSDCDSKPGKPKL